MTDDPRGWAQPVLLENEFARVRLTIDREGNSPRLRIEVLETDDVGFLDALVLERLVGLSQEELSMLFEVGQYASSKGAPSRRAGVPIARGGHDDG